MRAACRLAANVLHELAEHLAIGVNTYDLDQEGRRLIEAGGGSSACYDYRNGHLRFPAHTCLSVNDEIVHGIGSLKRVLRDGDIITLDVCVELDGWIGDNARTFAIGTPSDSVQKLLDTTEDALDLAIRKTARSGKYVNDIGKTIQRHVESRGFGIVREFVGHGVGRTMHEEPQIANFDTGRRGERLRPGMTLAIEPMVSLGNGDSYMAEDGWTALTRDGSPAAHFEHTVLITQDAPEILTLPDTAQKAESAPITNLTEKQT